MQSSSAQTFDLNVSEAVGRLRVNLDALAARQPVLAELVRNAQPAPVLVAKNGQPTCQFSVAGTTRWVHSAYDPVGEAMRFARLVPAAATAVMLVGGGLGHLPAVLVARDPARLVIVVEPELRFVRAMFMLFDLSDALRTGRLVVLRAAEEDAPYVAELPEDPFVLRWPALQDVYADKLRHLRYLRRRRGERGRIIAVAYKLLLGDIVEELELLGFAVRVVEPGELTVDSFRELAATVRPHLLFSMNHSPELALVATRQGIGYVSWTIDPLPSARLHVHPGTDVSRCLSFAHAHRLVAALRGAGLPNAFYLPLAAGRQRHALVESASLRTPGAPVSFAGVSLAVEREGLVRRLRQLGSHASLEARLEAWITEEFRAHGHALTYAGLRADGSALPAWLLGALPRADAVELTDRINGTLSHLLRLHRVEQLLPEGIHVWGDEGWEGFGEAYRGRAEHGAQLTGIYHASAVNLDIPRLYQRDIATMRVFDILACGGVLLTEPTPQLLEFFREGEHLFTYRSDLEMVARVKQLVSDPVGARLVAEQGRQLVLREHLLSHRVARMVSEAEARGLVGPPIPVA